jgi:hypothetical protein
MEEMDQSHAPAALSLGKYLKVPIGYEVSWTPQPVWKLWNRGKLFTYAGNRTRVAQPLVRHYTDWVIRLPDMGQ